MSTTSLERSRRLRFERRLSSSIGWTLTTYGVAVALSLLLTLGLIVMSGADPIKAVSALLKGGFGSVKAITDTMARATPLILTGLATVVAYRAQIWNIGQEGQVYAGAMAAFGAMLWIGAAPFWVLLPVLVMAAIMGGMLLGALTAVLKSRFSVNEIIATVMMNYLVVLLLSWLIGGGPWTEVGATVVYQQSAAFPEDSWLPYLLGSKKLHLGFVLALMAAFACHILLKRTALGYEIRAMGANPVALSYRGTNVKTTLLIVMMISGALAAMAGFSEAFGNTHRLRSDTLMGFGYTGILIAMIGGLTPWGTVVAALIFGGLESGALYMKLTAKVPGALVPTMEGILMLTFLCAGVLARYRLVWGTSK